MSHETITDIAAYMADLGRRARAASRDLARASTKAKDEALNAIADAIDASRAALGAANAQDLGAAKGLDAALLDRLELTEGRIDTMIEGLRQIAALPDPVGAITDLDYRPSGHPGRAHAGAARCRRHHLRVAAQRDRGCRRALSQVGQRDLLRGGSEAFESNQAIAACIRRASSRPVCPPTACRWSRPPIAPRSGP
jgi:glutamate-5-semialdehyde dehydrogenase